MSLRNKISQNKGSAVAAALRLAKKKIDAGDEGRGQRPISNFFFLNLLLDFNWINRNKARENKIPAVAQKKVIK